MLNLQSGKLSGAVTVHDDQLGDVLVRLPQVPTCRFQLGTQKVALMLEHLYGRRHPQFEPAVIDQIVFHHARTIYCI
ncbi:hypothetical protein D3C73_1591820 [compost metagenome]